MGTRKVVSCAYEVGRWLLSPACSLIWRNLVMFDQNSGGWSISWLKCYWGSWIFLTPATPQLQYGAFAWKWQYFSQVFQTFNIYLYIHIFIEYFICIRCNQESRFLVLKSRACSGFLWVIASFKLDEMPHVGCVLCRLRLVSVTSTSTPHPWSSHSFPCSD